MNNDTLGLQGRKIFYLCGLLKKKGIKGKYYGTDTYLFLESTKINTEFNIYMN